VQAEVVTAGDAAGPVEHPLVVEGFGDGGLDLDLDWNGIGRHPSAFAELLEGGGVRLGGGGEPSEVVPRSFLGRRLPTERADVAVTIGVPAGSGVRGGLLLRVSERAVLELSVGGAGTVSCVRVTPGERVVLASGPARDVGAVRLELSVDGLTGRASVDGDLFASVDLAGLSPEAGRDFVGAWVGPVAVGPSSEVVTATSFVLAVRP
jgi:hypothetical protein